MPTVSLHDLGQISRFLEVVRATPLDSDGAIPRPVLAGLGALIPADLVESFEIRRSDRAVVSDSFAWDVPAPPRDVDAALERFRAQNPLGAFKWGPAHGPLRLSRVIGRRELRRLDFYDGYLRPLRVSDQLKVWLSSTTAATRCVLLQRTDREFSNRDAAVLSVIHEHLARMRVPSRHDDERRRRHSDSSLTAREAQVLTWAATGRTNREVGDVLFMSEATVRKHLERAYAKLGARNRTEAIALMTGGPPQ
jgi:DNA-binding CsgD family transcriptional regulator